MATDLLDRLLSAPPNVEPAPPYPGSTIQLKPFQQGDVTQMLKMERPRVAVNFGVLASRSIFGVLANPPGSGKTIEIAALLSTHPRPTASITRTKVKATLIMTTRETIAQWRDRLTDFNPGLTVRTFGGTEKAAGDIHSVDDLHDADVVLVDLGVLPHERHRMDDFTGAVGREHLARACKPAVVVPNPSLLKAVEWWRLIVDEAQFFEVPSVTKVLCHLRAACARWVVSATPLRKGLRSLPALLEFLAGGDVWPDWADLVAEYSWTGRCDAPLVRELAPFVLRRSPDVLTALVKPQRVRDVPTQPHATELLLMLALALGVRRMQAEGGPTSVSVLAAVEALRLACLDPSRVLHEAIKKRTSARKARDAHRRGAISGAVEDGGRANFLRRAATPDLVLLMQPLLKLDRSSTAADLTPADLVTAYLAEFHRESRDLATLVETQLRHLPRARLHALTGVTSVADAAAAGPPLLALHEAHEAFAESLEAADATREDNVEGYGECPICLDDIELGDRIVSLPCACHGGRGGRYLKASCFEWLVGIGGGNVARCPLCRTEVDAEAVETIVLEDAAHRAASRRRRLTEWEDRRNALLTPIVRDSATLARQSMALSAIASGALATGGLMPPLSGKMGALVELMLDESRMPSDEKVVVFSAVKEALPCICAALADAGVPAHIGGCASLAAFRSQPASNCRALVLQAGDGTSGTAAAGIDLPCATHVVLLDVMSSDVEEQCARRVRRIGQPKETTLWRITTEASVDSMLNGIVAGGRRISAEAIQPTDFERLAERLEAHLEPLRERLERQQVDMQHAQLRTVLADAAEARLAHATAPPDGSDTLTAQQQPSSAASGHGMPPMPVSSGVGSKRGRPSGSNEVECQSCGRGIAPIVGKGRRPNWWHQGFCSLECLVSARVPDP